MLNISVQWVIKLHMRLRNVSLVEQPPAPQSTQSLPAVLDVAILDDDVPNDCIVAFPLKLHVAWKVGDDEMSDSFDVVVHYCCG